jgi:hypothetical protein
MDQQLTEHCCGVNTGPTATGPDDPRYRPCGEPAPIKEGGTWMCAEHYDQWAALICDRSLIFGTEEEL